MMVNMKAALAVLLPAVLTTDVDADLVLSENIMKLSQISAFLSNEAYVAEPNSTGFVSLENFLQEPDQAIIAEKDGYCFLAFRGTTLTLDDWYQNFDTGISEVCAVDSDECCRVRKGFFDAYDVPSFKDDLEKAVQKCVEKCSNRDECLVLTGHSQGGAVAAVAGIKFANMNPYVITFGEPPSVIPGCKVVSAERWYRFINSIRSEIGRFGITYDPVPFAPGLGTLVYGQMIILGEDTHDVVYIGLNSTRGFQPINLKGANAHSMVGTPIKPGYMDRINSLIEDAGSYPIPAQGWTSPNYCSEDDECKSGQCKRETVVSYERCFSDNCTEDSDCDTGRCDFGGCYPKLGSCMKCDEDEDCLSGKCFLFRCANVDRKMDNECSCLKNKDCESNRCEGLLPPICEARLALEAKCDEHSDCISGNCDWNFKCADGKPAGPQFPWVGVVLFAIGVVAVVAVVGIVLKCSRRGYSQI